jgi:hypothetical protein
MPFCFLFWPYLMLSKHHQVTYPILSRIARDYLAIQGSATPSERAFSAGALIGTKQQNSLKSDTFEALHLLRSAYRHGCISAAEQAAEHLQSLRDSLDDFQLADISNNEDDIVTVE